MRRLNLKRKKQGNIALALLLTTSMLFIGNLEVLTIINQQRMQSFVDGRAIALATAEAGAQDAIWEFNFGGAYFTGNGWSDGATNVDCTAPPCVAKTVTLQEDPTAAGTSPNNTATVVVNNYKANTPEIVSIGIHTASGTRTKIRVDLQQIAINSPYQQAGYGTMNPTSFPANAPGVWMQGASIVDSYDSTHGDYGASYMDPFGSAQLNRASNGLVATSYSLNDGNPSNPGDKAITIFGNSILYGGAHTAGGEIVTSWLDSVPENITTYQSGGTLPHPDQLTNVPAKTFLTATTPDYTCSSTINSVNVKNVWLSLPPAEQLTDPVTGQRVVRMDATHLCYNNLTVNPGYKLELPNLRYLRVNNILKVSSSTTLGAATLTVGQGVIRTGEYDSGCCFSGEKGGVLEGTQGPVDLYFRNINVAHDGEMRGKGKLAENLRLYQAPDLGTSTNRHIHDGVKIYGTIYSPTVTTGLGTGTGEAPVEMFGAVISQQMLLMETTLHYDEHLKDVTYNWPIWMAGSGARRVTTSSWKQEK